MDLGNLKDKLNSFGWEVEDINGHNIEDLKNYFDKINNNEKPKALIANTIKGKGFSFSENNNVWHHSVITKKIYDSAIEELKNGN
jgi:transketolase